MVNRFHNLENDQKVVSVCPFIEINFMHPEFQIIILGCSEYVSKG
jgi:hypothetical protein